MNADGRGERRDESGSGVDPLTDPEVRFLWLLDGADTSLVFDGRLRWSLDADDLCELIGIALELPEVVPGGVEFVRKRVAALLGATAPPLTWSEVAACWSDGAPVAGVEPCP
jgi:hypothetical protein